MARNLAGAEARSKGQRELERRQLGPHHTQPLPGGSRLPPAKLIIEKHLSSQKTMENPLSSKENVCYKAYWLGLFENMSDSKTSSKCPRAKENLFIFKLKIKEVHLA